MNFNKQDLKELKKLYNEAVKNDKESFMFKEHELLVIYAKYLIQYLETMIKD